MSSVVIRSSEELLAFVSTRSPEDSSYVDARGVSFDVFDVRFANLAGFDFQGSSLENSTLVDCNLTGASFRDSDVSGVNFTRSDLTGAAFFSCICVKTYFVGVQASDCRWEDSVLKGAVFSRSFEEVEEAQFLNCDFRDATTSTEFAARVLGQNRNVFTINKYPAAK